MAFIPSKMQVFDFITSLESKGMKREAAIARIASSCPLRIKDILNLSPSDIEGNKVKIINRSGRAVSVDMPVEAIKEIQAWIKEQSTSEPLNYVFQTQSGESMGKPSGLSYVRRVFRDASTKDAPITADSLRRFWAYEAFHSKGVTLEELTVLLGRKIKAEAAAYIGYCI